MCCKPGPIGRWAAPVGPAQPYQSSETTTLWRHLAFRAKHSWPHSPCCAGGACSGLRWSLAQVPQPCVLSSVSVFVHLRTCQHCVAVSVLCWSLDSYDCAQINIFIAVLVWLFLPCLLLVVTVLNGCFLNTPLKGKHVSGPSCGSQPLTLHSSDLGL